MRLLHLSDLHIGKNIYGHSMLEDQRHILKQIAEIADLRDVDAILIAGDIYDKTVPKEGAITLFDWFLTELNKQKKATFIVSGNHDSAKRLDFGSSILQRENIWISGEYQGALPKITIQDKFGPLNIFLMPFIKPLSVKKYADVHTYEEAVKFVLSRTVIKEEERNVLVAHQFVTNGTWMPAQCDSEIEFIGGLDHVDCKLFEKFDYTALGHLHGAQKVKDNIRYAGSPLKYSFSECRQKKTVVFITMEEKGNCDIELIPLKPLFDMREIKGPFAELIKPEVVKMGNKEDYIRAILTDEEELYEPMQELRREYPNLLRMDFENSRTNASGELISAEQIERKSVLELFEEFYSAQNGTELNDYQKKYAEKILNDRKEL